MNIRALDNLIDNHKCCAHDGDYYFRDITTARKMKGKISKARGVKRGTYIVSPDTCEVPIARDLSWWRVFDRTRPEEVAVQIDRDLPVDICSIPTPSKCPISNAINTKTNGQSWIFLKTLNEIDRRATLNDIINKIIHDKSWGNWGRKKNGIGPINSCHPMKSYKWRGQDVLSMSNENQRKAITHVLRANVLNTENYAALPTITNYPTLRLKDNSVRRDRGPNNVPWVTLQGGVYSLNNAELLR